MNLKLILSAWSDRFFHCLIKNVSDWIFQAISHNNRNKALRMKPKKKTKQNKKRKSKISTKTMKVDID